MGTVTVVIEPATPSPVTAQISLTPVTHLPTISFPSTAGRLYHIQYLNNIPVSGSWGILVTNLPGSGSLMSISDTNTLSRRFYRVGVR